MTPRYGYKPTTNSKRDEVYRQYAELLWRQHCYATESNYEPLADDGSKPDCLTDGVPTELMIFRGWHDGEFPFPRVLVPDSKWKLQDGFPEGDYIVMNTLGTNAYRIPFGMDCDQEVKTRTHTGWSYSYRFDVGRCEQFKLEKIKLK
ncbi:MAG: hypothetical protein ACSHX8_11135 [Opitutaceae bacterium]